MRPDVYNYDTFTSQTITYWLLNFRQIIGVLDTATQSLDSSFQSKITDKTDSQTMNAIIFQNKTEVFYKRNSSTEWWVIPRIRIIHEVHPKLHLGKKHPLNCTILTASVILNPFCSWKLNYNCYWIECQSHCDKFCSKLFGCSSGLLWFQHGNIKTWILLLGYTYFKLFSATKAKHTGSKTHFLVALCWI